jgi:NADH dehydrogenase (ubiquinone) Fe-S protein 4
MASADDMHGTRMTFNTKEDAIAFAEKRGWEYYIQEPHNRQFEPKCLCREFQLLYPLALFTSLFLMGF